MRMNHDKIIALVLRDFTKLWYFNDKIIPFTIFGNLGSSREM